MDSPRPRPVMSVSEQQQQQQRPEEEGKDAGLYAVAPGGVMRTDSEDEEEEDMPPLENEGVASNEETARMKNITTSTDGDVFLVLGLPAHSTVGCDAKAIGTGPATLGGGGGGDGFQGIRDIPPGTHFIWVSEPSAMSRCGYWFVTDPATGRQVRVKQWDKFNEVLVDPASQFEVRDHRENVASLYPQLVPYGFEGARGGGGRGRDGLAMAGARPTSNTSMPPEGISGVTATKSDEAQLWERLTCCVTNKVLSRVTGKTGASEWLVDTSDTAAGETGGVAGPATSSFLSPLPGQTGGPSTNTYSHTHKAVYQTLVGSTGELHFLFPEGDIDLHEYKVGVDHSSPGNNRPGAATDAHLPDTSLDILRLVDTPGTGITGEDLVGELQFTFLTGLHLSNLSCVDQWWHLVLKVFLRAHELLAMRPSLSLLFLQTLYAQMIYNEEYIVGGTPSQPPPTSSSSTNRVQEVEEMVNVDVRHEYGGGASNTATGNNATSILDIVPGNKKKLRAALTLYKRRMNEILLDDFGGARGGKPGGPGGDDNIAAQRREATTITPEQSAVGQVFAELEAWFWRLGWDLRTDYVHRPHTHKSSKEGGKDEEEDEEDGDEGYGYEDDDEYKPVIVDLDENGREVGMISFD